MTQTVDSTIEIVWSAYRSVLSKAGSLAYASTAITSGVLMQDTMDATGLTEDELKSNPDFFALVIKPNLERGTQLAREIAATSDRPVVAPAIFEGKPQRWSQADYMRMWLSMIEEHVTLMHMLPGWEYSNGGCEEYLKAINMAYGFGSRHNIKPVTPDGELIPLSVGMKKIANALVDIHDRGRKADTIFSVFKGLYGAHMVWRVPELMDELPADKNDELLEACGDVSRVVSDIATLLREDYGWDGRRITLQSDTGEIREVTATPEGIILPKPVDDVGDDA